MGSGVRPAQVHTTERGRSPVYHCSLLAALVGISCNTSTQTFTVPTKIAVTCICMTVFDKGSHINLENKRGRWEERASDFIAWAVQIPVAQFSAGVLLLEGVSEVIYHKYKAFSKFWIQFFIKSGLWMTILYLPYRSKEKFNWWLLTSMTVYTFCLFILKSMLNVTVLCFHKANAATYSHPVSFAWRIAKPELQLMIE